MIDFYSVFIVI